jgi:RNA polymerase sigma-70 factor, ECF subfamily
MSTDFAKAYDDHVGRVYGFFAYRVGSLADAEDLTQLTFERALRAWNRFDENRAHVATWLLAIARNALIDHYRRTRSLSREASTPESAERELPDLPGPEESVGVEPELAAALETLGPPERELIALRFGADLSGHQIAEMLELSLASVQQRLSRSLRKLRVALEGDADSEGFADRVGTQR